MFKKNPEMSGYLPSCVSDSTTILSWIQSPPIKFKPYVKNKVIEIQNILPSSNWRYVPSSKNKAADLLSKGCTKAKLELIINGPDILQIPDKEWPNHPKNKENMMMDELVIERKMGVAKITEPILDIEKYSTWKKLLRITAYEFKFIKIEKRIL